MATRQTIDRALVMMSTQYQSQRLKLSDAQLEIERDMWQDEFAGTPDDVFTAAVRGHMRSSNWFPAFKDVYDQIDGLEALAEGGGDWSQAWQAVKNCISRYGAWGTSDEVQAYFSEKLPPAMADDTRAIVARMGWRELCAMDIDQEGMWRAQFRDMFNVVRKQRVERRRMSPEVAKLIEDMARRFAADRARLPAPREDDGDEEAF